MLEAFERFLDTPALVLQLGEAICRVKFFVEQVGYQDALLNAGPDVTDQSHALGRARAFIVERVALVRRGQRDDLLERLRGRERTPAGEATGIIDAHEELDGAEV